MLNLKSKKYFFIYLIIFKFSNLFSDNTLDSTFGQGKGYIKQTYGDQAQINSTKIQSDQKIVIGGFTNNPNAQFLIGRFNTDGVIDTSFGTSGFTSTSIVNNSTSNQQISEIGLQSDGKIITVGNYFDTGINVRLAIARYTTSGILDTSYGTNGISTSFNIAPMENGIFATSVAIQLNDFAVVGGYINLNGIPYYIILRYDTNGNLDTTFNGTGFVIGLSIPFSNVNSVKLDSIENIVIGGYYNNGTSQQFFAAQYNNDGSTVTTFETTTIANQSILRDLGFQTIGLNANKIIGGGFSTSTSDQFTLIRYNTDGTIDTGFGSNGIVITPINFSSQIFSIAIQSDDKIIVAGYTSNNEFGAARYNDDGSIDTTFGTNGIWNLSLGITSILNSINIQSDGKYVVGGFSDDQMVIARLRNQVSSLVGISNPINNMTYNSLIVPINGTSTNANSTVKVYVDNILFTTVTTDGSGNWDLGLSNVLTDGTHQVMAQLLDVSNNVTATHLNNFILDTSVTRDFSIGNALRVDQIFGNDATGIRFGPPFMTINAALLQAKSGDVVLVYPGTYNEKITIPAGVAIFGTANTTIQQTNVISDTDLITMGENSTLANVTLSLTSTQHVNLRGIVFSGTTSITAKVALCRMIVDNSTASIGGTSNVYGIHSTGTGLPIPSNPTINNSFVFVKSKGNGNKRAVLVDGANNFNVKDSTLTVLFFGGSGSFVAAETNNIAANLFLQSCLLTGSTNFLQTLGKISFAFPGTTGTTGVSGTTGTTGTTGTIGTTGTTGEQGVTGTTGTDVTGLNYSFAYDTTTQTLSGSFADVTFNNNGPLNGWSHTAGTASFTCNQTGLYEISYMGTIVTTSNTANFGASMHLVLNGTEIPGSQTANSLGLSSTLGLTTINSSSNLNLINSVLVNVNSSDVIKLQALGSNAQLSFSGSGTAKTSVTIVITRIA